MTRSYGGGPPDPKRRDNPGWRNPEQENTELRSEENSGWADDASAQQSEKPQWQRKLDSLSKYADGADTAVKPVRIDGGRRLVALIIDFAVANGVAVAISFIPIINKFLFHQLIMVVVLLVRDWFFEGRGVGKNLMGLQVVDIMTGQPCSLIQSIKRNAVVLGPILIYYILSTILSIIPVPIVTSAVRQIIELAGTAYTLIVLPYEAYRVYSRADGMRFGDQFAGTAIVEAKMDFSTPVPRQ